MPSKTLTGVWAGLDLALLLAGGLSIAMSIVWRAPDLRRDLIISTTDLNSGLGLGVMFAITFVISLAAILTRNTVSGLKALNWVLVADSVATIVIGSIVWFWTLEERNNFSKVWGEQSLDIQGKLQDQFQCCGYFNGTDRAVSTGVCASPTFLSNATGCVDSITGYADYALNNIFTSIYGFQAIIVALFLATMCIINKRLEEERFRKIDEKRGGRGFV